MTQLLKNTLLVLTISVPLMSCKKEEVQKIYCEESSLCQLAIYPNPTDSLVNLSFFSNLTDSAAIKLFSLPGIMLRDEQIAVASGENELILDLSDELTGVYLVMIEPYSKTEHLGQRIVKQ